MDEFRANLQKHKNIIWVILLGYIIFNGCVVFPFSNELFPFDFDKAMMVVTCYGLIGICFTGLLSKSNGLLVFVLSLICTVIGMLLRFLLEYGEVSNTMNFIPINIAAFVIIVPIYCMAVYWAIYKFCNE